MLTKEWRLDVHLRSAELLAEYMNYKGLSVRELAQRVGTSRATIGHLRSGKRTYCNPALATKIAKVLDAPPSLLFLPRASNVTREVEGPAIAKRSSEGAAS